MHVALISDAMWLDDELPQFQAMVVGLMDEQVRVAQVVPERLDVSDTSAFGECIAWKDSRWSFLRHLRLGAMLDELRTSDVDLIHALSARVWSGAASLARHMDAPVVFSASSIEEVQQAARTHRRSAGLRLAYTASSKPLADMLHKQVGPQTPVQVIAPGVHRGNPRKPSTTDSALCAVITGNGHLDDQYRPLLEAMVSIVRSQPQAQFFLDGQDQDQHDLWRALRRMDLLSNVSLVPRKLGHHELLLNADVLIQPQALGRSRSLMLQAMVQGIPVIARADPWLDYLVPDQTAWVIDSDDADPWAAAIQRIADRPDAAVLLGRTARDWVSEKHVMARQVSLTLALYRRIAGESIKFNPQRSAG